MVSDITSTSMMSGSSCAIGFFAGALLRHANDHISTNANNAHTANPGKATKKKGAMNASDRHAIDIQMKREGRSLMHLEAERMISKAIYTEPTIRGLTKKKATSAMTCSQRSGCFISP